MSSRRCHNSRRRSLSRSHKTCCPTPSYANKMHARMKELKAIIVEIETHNRKQSLSAFKCGSYHGYVNYTNCGVESMASSRGPPIWKGKRKILHNFPFLGRSTKSSYWGVFVFQPWRNTMVKLTCNAHFRFIIYLNRV